MWSGRGGGASGARIGAAPCCRCRRHDLRRRELELWRCTCAHNWTRSLSWSLTGYGGESTASASNAPLKDRPNIGGQLLWREAFLQSRLSAASFASVEVL